LYVSDKYTLHTSTLEVQSRIHLKRPYKGKIAPAANHDKTKSLGIVEIQRDLKRWTQFSTSIFPEICKIYKRSNNIQPLIFKLHCECNQM